MEKFEYPRDRFVLEGVTYYQEYRKCGRDNCWCVDGEGLHGPYWYARENGSRRYIGLKLPLDVKRARAVRAKRRGELLDLRFRYKAAVVALDRLIQCDVLQDEDRRRLEELGFGDCLVEVDL